MYAPHNARSPLRQVSTTGPTHRAQAQLRRVRRGKKPTPPAANRRDRDLSLVLLPGLAGTPKLEKPGLEQLLTTPRNLLLHPGPEQGPRQVLKPCAMVPVRCRPTRGPTRAVARLAGRKEASPGRRRSRSPPTACPSPACSTSVAKTRAPRTSGAAGEAARPSAVRAR